MTVVRDFAAVPPELTGGAIAIGNFDGVHRGHQALLAHARTAATRLGGPAGVLVFDPHPRAVFRPADPFFELTPLDTKIGLLASQGMQLIAVAKFDPAFAALTPAAFIEQAIVGWLGARQVVICYDFFFGTPAVMQAAGDALGFGVTVVSPVAEAGEVFSSSAVRAKLATGEVAAAARDLGHWWTVSGAVVGGFKRGTDLGFPTANVRLPPGTTLAHGIYAVRVTVAGITHNGAAYLGTRPTFDDGAPVLEVFLLDFNGDLYGQQIEIAFVGHVRGDKRFDSAEALVQQMDADCAVARQMLAAAGESPL